MCIMSAYLSVCRLIAFSSFCLCVVDPAWNPSIDNQAVDRSFRMGQTRDVVIYRFVTCGTIEEVIYRKQVFKMQLFHAAVNNTKTERYVSTRI
jgi:SNF2 family DNA or RNA helicase